MSGLSVLTGFYSPTGGGLDQLNTKKFYDAKNGPAPAAPTPSKVTTAPEALPAAKPMTGGFSPQTYDTSGFA